MLEEPAGMTTNQEKRKTISLGQVSKWDNIQSDVCTTKQFLVVFDIMCALFYMYMPFYIIVSMHIVMVINFCFHSAEVYIMGKPLLGKERVGNKGFE